MSNRKADGEISTRVPSIISYLCLFPFIQLHCDDFARRLLCCKNVPYVMKNPTK